MLGGILEQLNHQTMTDKDAALLTWVKPFPMSSTHLIESPSLLHSVWGVPGGYIGVSSWSTKQQPVFCLLPLLKRINAEITFLGANGNKIRCKEPTKTVGSRNLCFQDSLWNVGKQGAIGMRAGKDEEWHGMTTPFWIIDAAITLGAQAAKRPRCQIQKTKLKPKAWARFQCDSLKLKSKEIIWRRLLLERLLWWSFHVYH